MPPGQHHPSADSGHGFGIAHRLAERPLATRVEGRLDRVEQIQVASDPVVVARIVPADEGAGHRCPEAGHGAGDI